MPQKHKEDKKKNTVGPTSKLEHDFYFKQTKEPEFWNTRAQWPPHRGPAGPVRQRASLSTQAAGWLINSKGVEGSRCLYE